jgi:rRNA-processing protein FCF1
VTLVLDTNALMMPVECDVRLFDELDRLRGGQTPLVPRPVERELGQLADDGGKPARAARVGLDLLGRCERRETAANYADDAVLELALATGGPAVTNDRPLRDRLLDADISVIGLREKNKLALTQP